jgi:tRNA pseudouridine13 synthase
MKPIFSLDFPYAYGQPEATASFRVEPEDFQVDETLGFEPAGEGEHVYLHVWKRGENTAWVAERIAELAQVQVMDVGYCGRKDRHAVTTQWFSIYLPKKELEPDWAALNSESIKILSVSRHQHKLRRGDHETNRFIIRLCDFVVADKSAFEEKIANVLAQGVPNYYGEQRFGRNANNLPEAHAILVEGKRIRDKQKRGLMLSAARSYLFNQVLTTRVSANNWQMLLGGEPELYPTAPLWGRGRSAATGDALLIENAAMEAWAEWRDGLEHAGLSQERRALVLKPEAASWCWIGADLEISFMLGSGEFATTILRELAVLQSAIKTESASV